MLTDITLVYAAFTGYREGGSHKHTGTLCHYTSTHTYTQRTHTQVTPKATPLKGKGEPVTPQSHAVMHILWSIKEMKLYIITGM